MNELILIKIMYFRPGLFSFLTSMGISISNELNYSGGR